MAMLDPNGGYGLWPDLEPPTGPGGPLPFEADMARAAREAAAARMRRASRRGYDAALIEGPSDAAAMSALNANPGAADVAAPALPLAGPSVVSSAAAAPAPVPPAGPAPASPAAPAVPSWLGMLNGPLSNPRPAPMPSAIQSAPLPQAAPAPSPASPSSSSSSPSVPPTSVLARIGDAINSHSGTLLALGAGLAGSQNIGQGLSRGFAAAIPAMQSDIKLQQQNQTVAALIKRGLPQDVALAAAGNPAIMQQIIGQVFGPKALQHVTVKDRMGNEIPMAFDPSTGKYVSANVGGAGTSLAGGDPTKTGEEYLKTLDPQIQNEVKAFAEGRAPVTARNLQQMLPLVTQYDPSFDASQYPVRLATRKNYTNGKQFQEVQAINTVAGHLDNLSKSADDLNNTRFPWWNTLANATLQATGDPRVDKFNTDKQAVTNELSKAYRGGHVTEGDVREWQQNISAAKSPEQLKAVIGEMNDLLMSKRQALEDGYRSSMGKAPPPEEFSSVSKHAGEVFNRVADWAHGVKTEKSAAPAVPSAVPVQQGAPKPGNYQWTPDRGLVLVQ